MGLLETLSQATDMLTKADAIQVEYTENIRQAREKASAAVSEYRKTTEAVIAAQIASAAAERQLKAAAVKEKREAEGCLREGDPFSRVAVSLPQAALLPPLALPL